MRVAFVLPGLHRVIRGAEVAFEAIAHELAQYEDCQVTLFGSGNPRENTPYHFITVGNIDRKHFERWPQIPILRNEYIYEELSFALNLLPKYTAKNFDLTLTCSYPFLNWALRSGRQRQRPAHIFVTQNSDYPAITRQREYKFFGCDGLVCTNPEYFERNKEHWCCELITNGVDPHKFFPADAHRSQFGLPDGVPIVLMVSALIPSKRILEGIKAVAQVADWNLVICGDGPERERIRQMGEELLADRFHLKTLTHDQMPDMYRSADAFMHLSLDEPFGNVYLEALATGLPIIAHDRDVTRWIVEDTAILVDTTAATNIAAALQSVRQDLSPDAREKRLDLIQRRFTWAKIGESYYNFLKAYIN